jgi:chorismate mutase
MVRGIRGAIDVPENSRKAIFDATTRLLREILTRNELDTEAVASMFLTTTPDLNADFPAYAVRGNGLSSVPVLCASEIDVPGAMPSLVRILVHVNTDKKQGEIAHVYLGRAAKLRPDLAGEKDSPGGVTE